MKLKFGIGAFYIVQRGNRSSIFYGSWGRYIPMKSLQWTKIMEFHYKWRDDSRALGWQGIKFQVCPLTFDIVFITFGHYNPAWDDITDNWPEIVSSPKLWLQSLHWRNRPRN